MEMFNTGFYGRELKGEVFKYTPEQQEYVKRRILSNLPNVEAITNL